MLDVTAASRACCDAFFPQGIPPLDCTGLPCWAVQPLSLCVSLFFFFLLLHSRHPSTVWLVGWVGADPTNHTGMPRMKKGKKRSKATTSRPGDVR